MPFSDFWIENPATWGVAGFLFFWALETWLPFVQDRRERVVHAGRNVALTLMNAALIALVFVAAMAWMAGWADSNGMGLLHAFGAPAWAKSLLALLLIDAWIYGWHRLSHVVPILWRLHRVHHTDPAVDVSSATRFHSAEIFISSVFRLALIPLLGLSFGHLLLYDMLQLPVTQFHHSNLRLPEKVDRIVRALIVSPNMHRVHHSRLQVETDSNFSSIFSVWDRLAGTFRLRTHPETIEFGLDGFDAAERQTVWEMLGTPFLASSRESSPPQKKKKVFPFGLTSCNSGRGTIVSEGLPCGARRGGRSILSAPGTFEQVARNLFRCAGTRLPGSASFGFVTLRMPQNRTTGSALPGRFQPGAYESKILRSKWRRFEKENSHPPNQRFPATKSQ